MQEREEDREITWSRSHRHYTRTITIVQRIPINDVNTCLWCGDPLFDRPPTTKYCNNAHRVRYWRRTQENTGG